MTKRGRLIALIASSALAPIGAAAASGEDLFKHDRWPALASDRTAQQAGDILTVLVLESATGVHSAESSTRRDSSVSGRISGGPVDESAGLGLGGQFKGSAQTERTGRLVAQISVTVDEVLPNGDLAVSGTHLLTINRERTRIRLRGRVRRADIASGNTVLSSRLAGAEIDYDGSGFVSRSARPGLVQRIFGFLGLM
ncbi:flagellar basal body L-ring protein FlgH [Allosphingosinicella sp.]|jgi:flagellar L-ring protein precursor FlgH|uniref:flagellar basal body L-ring protein FlgH n=1 Tax=Allosphingosinicella sp. TaxID=2823234 RepID=UPI002F0B43CF